MKPRKYDITVTVRPQGADWQGAELEVAAKDIARESIIAPSYSPALRDAVRLFEQSMDVDLSDFPATTNFERRNRERWEQVLSESGVAGEVSGNSRIAAIAKHALDEIGARK
jgi:hypothetical protein